MLQNIGLIGDIHAGSKCAPWPERMLPADPAMFHGTRYLNQCYARLVEEWPELDMLILMGDLVDGKQRKSAAVGLYDADLGAQVDGAIEILRPLVAKAKRTVRVWGTPYHEDFDNALGSLDREFGIRTVKQVLDIDMGGGAILNVAHHPAAGGAVYQGTAVDKESLWSSIAAYERKVPNARWIVRAHKHNYMLQETERKTVLITPCWQLPTAHAIKQNYWRFQPTIGGVLMHADETHPSGYRFTATTYEVPMPVSILAENV